MNIELDRSKARKDSSELIAFASIVIEKVFVVSNIRVIRSDNGKIIVSMPSRQSPSGQYRDVAYPIEAAFRTHIDQSVMAAVDEAVRAKG